MRKEKEVLCWLVEELEELQDIYSNLEVYFDGRNNERKEVYHNVYNDIMSLVHRCDCKLRDEC